MVYGLGGMGIAVLTTAAFGTMGSTAAGMLGLGLCASAIFITATTLIQHETPHELLGRVMSCLMSLVAGSQVISMFVAGPVAEKIGIPNLYYGSAAMLIGIGVVGYFKLPKAEKAEAESGKLPLGCGHNTKCSRQMPAHFGLRIVVLQIPEVS